jgi:uncharacterized protein YpuA (DUF1002 family)
MDREEIIIRLEAISEDFGLELTERQQKKFVNLILELVEEDVDSKEIKEEFKTVCPDEEDETWDEFCDELTAYVEDLKEELEEEPDDEY